MVWLTYLVVKHSKCHDSTVSYSAVPDELACRVERPSYRLPSPGSNGSVEMGAGVKIPKNKYLTYSCNREWRENILDRVTCLDPVQCAEGDLKDDELSFRRARGSYRGRR